MCKGISYGLWCYFTHPLTYVCLHIVCYKAGGWPLLLHFERDRQNNPCSTFAPGTNDLYFTVLFGVYYFGLGWLVRGYFKILIVNTSFYYFGPHLWNKLQICVKSAATVVTFCGQFKTCLFHLALSSIV